jgi:hypothetical protein
MLERVGYSLYLTPLGRAFNHWFNATGAQPHSQINVESNVINENGAFPS